MSEGRLLFDGDCGFCTRSVRWLANLGILAYPAVPWQTVPDAELPVPVKQLMTEVVLELPHGRTLGGADALSASVCASGSGLRFLGRLANLPVVRSIARAVYRMVARNRYRIPGASAACKVDE